ncbi:beta-1,3-galactosyltransferase 5-like [Rhinophrynus dorsalis]
MRRQLINRITFTLSIVIIFLVTVLFWEPQRNSQLREYSLWDISTNTTHRTSTPPPTFPPMRESVNLTDGVHNYHLNFSQFELEFPYLQNYYCSCNITPREEPEEVTSQHLIILAIKSHPSSGTRREALRRTWARYEEVRGYRVRPIFLMATTTVSGQMEMVKQESKEYGDIIQWDFNEGHHNLSLKERCFLEWLHHHRPHVAFIFKGDDDEYVNPEAVVQYVKEHGSSSSILHGHVQHSTTVLRQGKYQVSKTLYPFHRYPLFLSGGGFLFPGPSVRSLYEASQKIPVFPLDDVYFAFLALSANLTYRNDERFYVTRRTFEPCLFKRALVVHGIQSEELVTVWKKVKNAQCKE